MDVSTLHFFRTDQIILFWKFEVNSIVPSQIAKTWVYSGGKEKSLSVPAGYELS